MTEPTQPTDPLDLPAEDGEPLEIRPQGPRPERLHNHLLGGPAHFAADQELAEQLTSKSPVDIVGVSPSARRGDPQCEAERPKPRGWARPPCRPGAS
jgi:hypothetical protein